MKRFFLAALAIAAIASCTKNEVNEVTANDQITFQTVVGPSTKALIDGLTYPTEDLPFGTVAYYNATSTTFPNSAELYIPESMVSYSSPYWSTATPYYWPKNGSLTFFSYSPYTELQSSMECDMEDGLTLTDWDVHANQTVDVMVADVQTGQTANDENGGYTGVPTIFRHKLSQIVNITFQTDKSYNAADGVAGSPYVAGDKLFFINYVKFNDLEQTGTYTSGKDVNGTNLGSWELPTSPSYDHDYNWFTEAGECDTEFNTGTSVNGMPNNYLLLMPQEYENNADPEAVSNIEIRYTIRTYTDPLNFSNDVVTAHVSMYDIFSSSHTLDMNKKVTINFTIGVDQIYWAPSVESWGNQTGAAEIN